MVTRRSRLEAGQRQQHLQQWQRQRHTDRTIEREKQMTASSKAALLKDGADIKKLKSKLKLARRTNIFDFELESDPDKIGFAYGGVEPGVLKARGQLHEIHRVHYSIGKVGTYLLHVGLRKRACPLPGSPFTLDVVPGPAHAPSTRLPVVAQPMRGVVGLGTEDGCRMVVRSADRMGNLCTSGGANVKCGSSADEVHATTADQSNGSYLLEWRSMTAGTFECYITIDGQHLLGSPVQIRLRSTLPDITKTELTGSGLSKAVAGRPTVVRLKFVDEYSNPACCGEKFAFGMALSEKAGEKLASVKAHTNWSGSWIGDDGDDYEMRYEAAIAGNMELHIWCDPEGTGERRPLPKSPFAFTVRSGKPVAAMSSVDGYAKERGDAGLKSTSKKRKETSKTEETETLIAGDALFIRPHIRDAYQNPATLPEGALVVTQLAPSGSEHKLEVNSMTKHGLVQYDVRFTPTEAGHHAVHVMLLGEPIEGSPVEFDVGPAAHDAASCVLIPPEEPLYIEGKYVARLETYDQYGNEAHDAGAQVAAKINYVKQGVHDATVLNQYNSAVSVDDLQNGTYAISIHLFKLSHLTSMVVNLVVNMDRDPKERPNGLDLAPATLTFVRREGGDDADAPAAADGGGKGEKSVMKRRQSAASLKGARRGSSAKLLGADGEGGDGGGEEGTQEAASNRAGATELRNSASEPAIGTHRTDGGTHRTDASSVAASSPGGDGDGGRQGSSLLQKSASLKWQAAQRKLAQGGQLQGLGTSSKQLVSQRDDASSKRDAGGSTAKQLAWVAPDDIQLAEPARDGE